MNAHLEPKTYEDPDDDWDGYAREAPDESPAQNPARAGALFRWSLIRIGLILCLLWAIRTYEQLSDVSLSEWGLFPRTARGLLGILTMPFLHGDMDHLYHNSFSFLLLGLGLFFFYPKVAWRVLIFSALIGSALVWCLARPSYHIGASGVVYSISAFLFISGLVRRDRMSRGAALLVMLNYGASIWGLFPLQQGISWEGHLFGAVVGAALALVYRKVDLPVQESWPDEVEDDEDFDAERIAEQRLEVPWHDRHP